MKKYFTTLTEKQKGVWAWSIAGVLLSIMFLIALFSSIGIGSDPGDSGTVDEIAHIPSGYTYVKDLDYRLNPEHPPLAKVLSGISLALNKDIKGPESDWSWNGINQWEAGWDMIYEIGNNPETLFAWARFPMMLLMIGLGLFLFKWISELFGRKVGLITLLLFCFYPDIIAHGRLVTTDVAAAFGYVISVYYFNKALVDKKKKFTIISGLTFGLAQLLKFSSFLLFFVFGIMIIVRAYVDRKDKSFWSEFVKNLKIYLWVVLISLLLVWIVYLPFVWNTPTDIEHKVIEANLTSDVRTEPLRNFLHTLEGSPFTRAIGHYLLGVMLVFARVAGGNNTFALGHLSNKSISWYFPFAWLVKTPISIIVMFLSSLVVSTVLLLKKKINKEGKWLLFIILLPWFIYWAFTLKGSLNIGIRHLMPTIPFVLLAIAFLINYLINQVKIAWITYVIYLLVIFQIYSVLSYFPSYIGYFNESVPKDQRYKYLIDSSLDWGQDMLRLKKYVDDNNITDIKVDYFGGSQVPYYLPNATEWHSSYGPTTGWLAVSATYYQSSKLAGPAEGKWDYSWLDKYTPTAQIGGSILVFHITNEDLIKNPPISSYPITTYEYPDSIMINDDGSSSENIPDVETNSGQL